MRKKATRQLDLFEEVPTVRTRSKAEPVSTRVDTDRILEAAAPPRFAWEHLESESGAWVTADGMHRLVLWRAWSSAPRALFAMLNPSSADALADDPTIRRCIGFAKGWGCGGINVVNLYSLIETDPKQLWETEARLRLASADDMQPAASTHAEVYARAAERSLGPLVLAWGGIPAAAKDRVDELSGALASCDRAAFCLGSTRHGHPRHPLFLPAVTKLDPVSRPLVGP